MDRYRDRKHAGQVLATHLHEYEKRDDVIVLALPRGGVPVGCEIAKSLHVPLDIFVVRKLGVPGHEELAMGALASGGAFVLNESIVQDLGISQFVIESVMAKETQELQRRNLVYRGNRLFPSLENKIVILVDDGVATGATLRAGIKALRQLGAQKIVAAVPVADETICQEMESLADKFVCPMRVTNLYAVGLWYEQFTQTEDEEVQACLKDVNDINKTGI